MLSLLRFSALFILFLSFAYTQEAEDLPNLALGSVEISGGFPGFRLYSVRLTGQFEAFGVALEGSYNEAGFYGSLAGRAYLPIPIPVPTYASLGAGIFVDHPIVFANIGTHIPLDRNFRVSLEAGASTASVLNKTQVLPYLSLALGYTFTFDPSAQNSRGISSQSAGSGSGSSCDVTEPDEASLESAFSRELRQFLAEARVTYAGTYRSLSYDVDITSTSINGTSGSVRASYKGSVTEIATGKKVNASGTIRASFRWNGCSWSLKDFDY